MAKLKVSKDVLNIMQKVIDEMQKEFDEGAGEVRYLISDDNNDDEFKVMLTIEKRGAPSVVSVHEFTDFMTYNLVYESDK